MSELPKGWIDTELIEISEIVLGQSPPSETYNETGEGLPFYQGKTEFGIKSPTPKKWCDKPKKIALENDILLSVRAPVGPTNLNAHEACIGRGLAAIRPVIVDHMYVYYYFKRIEPELSGKGTGTTFKAVTGDVVKSISIPLPPLAEQKRIVEKIEALFSLLDAGIAALEKTKAQLKRYKQSVLKAAFEGNITRLWRTTRPDEKSKLNLTKLGREELIKLKLPEIPESWSYVKLKELGELGRGKSKHRPRNDASLFNGEYPFVQTGIVKAAKKYITEYTQSYNEKGLAQSKLWPKGTLCITIAANIAETAFLDFDACFPDSVVGFVPENVNIEYIYYFFNAFQKNIEFYAPATAQKNINLNILENLVVPLAPENEQLELVNEIEKAFSVSDKALETVEHELKKAQALKSKILEYAFTGKLVPQNPDDEPAEKLLERIKAEKEASKPTKKTRKRK